jgi:hypothetical protein
MTINETYTFLNRYYVYIMEKHKIILIGLKRTGESPKFGYFSKKGKINLIFRPYLLDIYRNILYLG